MGAGPRWEGWVGFCFFFFLVVCGFLFFLKISYGCLTSEKLQAPAKAQFPGPRCLPPLFFLFQALSLPFLELDLVVPPEFCFFTVFFFFPLRRSDALHF